MGSRPPSNTRFLGLTRGHNPKGISIGSAEYAQLAAECLYTSQWAVPPLKIDPSHGLSGPHLIHGFLLLSKFSTKIARRSVKPFLQGSLLLATDRPHYSVCKTGHINVRSIVMWPNNNKCNITVGRSTPTHHGTAFHHVNIGSHSNPVNQQ